MREFLTIGTQQIKRTIAAKKESEILFNRVIRLQSIVPPFSDYYSAIVEAGSENARPGGQ